MSETPNVKRAVVLRDYPGWMIREYRDGHLDAAEVNGPAVSPGFTSWAEALAWVKASRRGWSA